MRRTIRIARKEGEPAEGVRDTAEPGAVCVWAGLPIPGDPDHNEPWVDGVQNIPADAPILHGAGLKVFDQDVRFLDEALQDRGSRVCAGQASPISCCVPRSTSKAYPPSPSAYEFAKRIAETRQFDFDDFGAEFRQLRGAKRTCHKVRDIEDPQAL